MAILPRRKRLALAVKAMRRRLFGYKIVQAGLQLWHNYSTDALDKSSNSNHGVMHTGRSLAFDGSNDYVDLGTSDNFYSGQFTINFWFKTSATGNRRFLDKNWDSVFVNLTTTGQLSFGIWDGSAHTFASTSLLINDGSWHRFTGVFTGTNLKTYIDNVLQAESTFSGSLNENGSTVYLGRSGGGEYLNGELSNVQIWDKAWTADDVAYDYNNPNASPAEIAAASQAREAA